MNQRARQSTKRRGRGEGSIFRRKDGSWCASITTGYGPTGCRRRQYIYAQTKREVQEKLTRLQGDVLNGTLVEPQKLKVGGYLNDYWLEKIVRPKARKSTYELYKILIRKHINPWIGGIALTKLTPAQVQDLYATLESRGASARLRETVHARLNSALDRAVKMGMVMRNVCNVVERPTSKPRQMRYLDREQTMRLLEAARFDRFYALYCLAITTGLRQGELLGLHWADINLDQRHSLGPPLTHGSIGPLGPRGTKDSKGEASY